MWKYLIKYDFIDEKSNETWHEKFTKHDAYSSKNNEVKNVFVYDSPLSKIMALRLPGIYQAHNKFPLPQFYGPLYRIALQPREFAFCQTINFLRTLISKIHRHNEWKSKIWKTLCILCLIKIYLKISYCKKIEFWCQISRYSSSTVQQEEDKENY